MIPERDTFLELGEILERSRESLRRVRRELESLPVQDERTRLFLATLVGRRIRLEDAIDQCIERAHGDAIKTYVQYGANPSADRAAWPVDASSPEAVAKWQTRMDEAIASDLRDLAGRVTNPGARDLLEALLELIEGHIRRVAIEVQQLRDI